eukprot:Amastigsp_a514603_36.p3 type:complete len:104 gc:universal Amastigsp_a514603_36:202-513(+)
MCSPTRSFGPSLISTGSKVSRTACLLPSRGHRGAAPRPSKALRATHSREIPMKPFARSLAAQRRSLRFMVRTPTKHRRWAPRSGARLAWSRRPSPSRSSLRLW